MANDWVTQRLDRQAHVSALRLELQWMERVMTRSTFTRPFSEAARLLEDVIAKLEAA